MNIRVDGKYCDFLKKYAAKSVFLRSGKKITK